MSLGLLGLKMGNIWNLPYMLTISKLEAQKTNFFHNHIMHVCEKFQVKRVKIGPAIEQNRYFILVSIQPLLQTSITITKNLNISSKKLTDPNFLWFNAFMTSKRLHPGPLCPQEADTQLQKKYNWPLYGLKGQSGL